MKNIPVSLIQRDKLIEMCIRLFPEYTSIRWGRSFESDYLWFDSIPNPKPGPVEIHWFELSITHLPEKLMKILKKIVSENENLINIDKEILYKSYEPALIPLDILDLMLMKDYHPIDTLWEEFLKLKKWDTNCQLVK
jgi:hypothetical protein